MFAWTMSMRREPAMSAMRRLAFEIAAMYPAILSGLTVRWMRSIGANSPHDWGELSGVAVFPQGVGERPLSGQHSVGLEAGAVESAGEFHQAALGAAELLRCANVECPVHLSPLAPSLTPTPSRTPAPPPRPCRPARGHP